MTYKGKPLFSWPTLRSGFRYALELEWEFAAHWRGYTREQFMVLDGDAQARIVALYRVRMHMDAVLEKQRYDAERRAQARARTR